MTRKFTFSFMLLMLTAILIAAAPAFADTLDFSLSNTVGYGQPGSVADFYATVTAPITNTGTIFLNGDSYNVNGGWFLDDSSYLNNFPLQLDPGQSYTGLLFEVSIPADTYPGISNDGYFEILGGANGGSLDTIGTTNFTVSATPEPSSILLLGSGLLALAGTVRRKVTS